MRRFAIDLLVTLGVTSRPGCGTGSELSMRKGSGFRWFATGRLVTLGVTSPPDAAAIATPLRGKGCGFRRFAADQLVTLSRHLAARLRTAEQLPVGADGLLPIRS